MCVHGLRGLFCLFNIRKTHKKEPLLRIILFSLVDATGFEPAVSHPARSVLNACHWHAGLRSTSLCPKPRSTGSRGPLYVPNSVRS